MKGVVIDTKLFSRRKLDPASKKEENKRLAEIEKDLELSMKELNGKFWGKLTALLTGQKAKDFVDREGNVLVSAGAKIDIKSIEGIDPLKLDPRVAFTGD